MLYITVNKEVWESNCALGHLNGKLLLLEAAGFSRACGRGVNLASKGRRWAMATDGLAAAIQIADMGRTSKVNSVIDLEMYGMESSLNRRTLKDSTEYLIRSMLLRLSLIHI